MIREATSEDSTNLAALSIKVWLETYAQNGIKQAYSDYVLKTFTEAHFLELMVKEDCHILVSENNHALQGYALINLKAHFETPDNGFELEKLYVDSCCKGQGIGRALLNEITMRFGPVFWLYTWRENKSNHFYQHLGFDRIGQLTFEFAGQLITNHVYRTGRKKVKNH